MDLSGIIFVVLAVAWAVYLIPKALKHHDEVARTRSVDRFSNAMRVLARREPVNRRDTRLVVTPPRTAGSRVVVPPPRPVDGSSPTSVSAPASGSAPVTASTPAPVSRPGPGERAAARAAARRRRHILLFLLVADAAVVTVAALGFAPWWSVAIPAVLTMLYLFLCRTQVRRQSEALWASAASAGSASAGSSDAGSAVAPRRAIRVDAPYGTPRESSGPDEEDTVALSAASLRAAAGAGSLAEAEEAVAVTVTTVDGESLWDPLPVTLPTYVGKAKAARTVRTIDLGAPGTWTSGHTEEDSRLVEQAEAEAASASTEAPQEQRAVGS